MKIEIISIKESSEKNVVDLIVRFDEHEERSYKASSEEKDGIVVGNIDEELFYYLSELGVRNLCNSAYYHMVVGIIVRSFLRREIMPAFPIDLTSDFDGFMRPSRFQILKGRIRRIFMGLHPMGTTSRHGV